MKSLSTDAEFNILNPSERNVVVKDLTAGTDLLWPLVVRTISFFFLKSRSAWTTFSVFFFLQTVLVLIVSGLFQF